MYKMNVFRTVLTLSHLLLLLLICGTGVALWVFLPNVPPAAAKGPSFLRQSWKETIRVHEDSLILEQLVGGKDPLRVVAKEVFGRHVDCWCRITLEGPHGERVVLSSRTEHVPIFSSSGMDDVVVGDAVRVVLPADTDGQIYVKRVAR